MSCFEHIFRKMKRSNAQNDWRDPFQRKRSDKRDKRDNDRHRARAFIGDSQSELNSQIGGMKNFKISGLLYFIFCPKFLFPKRI